jgi:hypothetical protein
MNYTIAPAKTKRKKDRRLRPHTNLQLLHGGVSRSPHRDSNYARTLRDTSLPWEILETAHALFLHKGFERTTVADICRSLGIRLAQFYGHFDSLDEVLEVLWAR